MKYKEITLILLKNIDIECVDSERYKNCKWNKKAKYNENGICINAHDLEDICGKCLLKNIKEVMEEMS